MAGDGSKRRGPGRTLRIPLLVVVAAALAVAVLAAPVSAAETATPPNRRMTLAFPHQGAPIAGPGALVRVHCLGSSAARCIGTLSLSVAGSVHKAPFSISKGRRQYVVVPLGRDLEPIDSLDGVRATVTASTIQGDGAAVTARKTLRLE